MTEPSVLIDTSVPMVTTLTLNRPTKRNALNIALLEDLSDAIEATQRDLSQRVIILKGAGNVFCSGLDLEEASEANKEKESTQAVARVLKTLWHCPLVTIAVVQGGAIAGGAGLMLGCDIAIADPDAKISFPEVRRGLIAAQIMPMILRKVGDMAARSLLFLGNIIDAKKAHALGLLYAVYPLQSLNAEAMKIASLIMQGAPQALVETKKFLDSLYPTDFEEEIERGVVLHQKMRHSKEAQEGILAFLERRSPNWDQFKREEI